MARRVLLSALCVGFAVLLSTSSWAATAEPTEGALMINKGKGFKQVEHRVVAKVGDTLMVSLGGHAKLVYADGCKVDIEPGAMTTVAPLSPCASGANAQSQSYGTSWCVTPPTPNDYNNP